MKNSDRTNCKAHSGPEEGSADARNESRGRVGTMRSAHSVLYTQGGMTHRMAAFDVPKPVTAWFRGDNCGRHRSYENAMPVDSAGVVTERAKGEQPANGRGRKKVEIKPVRVLFRRFDPRR